MDSAAVDAKEQLARAAAEQATISPLGISFSFFIYKAQEDID